jgi:hypothetical protein
MSVRVPPRCYSVPEVLPVTALAPRAAASRGSQFLAPAALIHTHPAQNLAALHRLTVAPIAVGADGSSPRSPPLDCSKGFLTFYSDLLY